MLKLLDYIKSQVLVFDGAMGRELQKKGLPDDVPPELWNADRPEIIEGLHQAYAEAGAGCVTTNTFGGSSIKLAHYGLEERTTELNRKGVALAKKAVGDSAYVAGSMGPTGVFVEPLGELSFDAAYAVFFEQAQALIEAGADAIILETMADLGEIRAALLAVKDAGDVPVIASMTYNQDNRTLTGTDPETAAVVLEGLGADIIGVNCSGGPAQLFPIVEILCSSTNLPVLVEPNAGLPELEKGITVYKETPESMAEYAQRFASLGAEVIGSCCGSTPDHTRAIAHALAGKKPMIRQQQFPLRVTSRYETVNIGSGFYPVIIGERINPTGKKDLADDIRAGKNSLLKSEALSQVKEGAHLLDINVAVPGTNEAEAMEAAVNAVQNLVRIPLSLDSPDPAALEAGLKKYHGKALVNSVNADPESMDWVLPLVKRYGAAVIALCMDDKGIPGTVEGRLAAAEYILTRAQELGIAKENIIVDGLTLTASADAEAPALTLKCVKEISDRLKLPTVLGVSNVSFGLPERPNLNSAFLAAAMLQGLDAAIINPLDRKMVDSFRASAVLAGRDAAAEKYIAYCGSKPKSPELKSPKLTQTGSGEVNSATKPAGARGHEEQAPVENYGLLQHQTEETVLHPLTEAIVRGDKEAVVPVLEEYLAQGLVPMVLLDDYLVPGIEIVGEKYAKGEYFLPQLMLAADAMQAAFARIEPELDQDSRLKRDKVVMATVKGDIHDIGKNIVSVMLRNHGFEVIDLGKNVGNEEIIEAAAVHEAQVIGLSALMTTTMPRMEEITALIQQRDLPYKVIIGGAAVTQRYADDIGADGYGKDAVAAVEVVKGLLQG